MRVTKKLEHVRLFSLTGNCYCYHCGDMFEFQRMLPMSITMSAAVLKQYAKEHRRCKESDEGRDLDASHRRLWAAYEADKKKEEPP